MIQEIKVPEVGESISEGLLVAWLRVDGALVQVDDPLFELETDKITMEVPSPHAGRLAILVAAGETVKVGQRVATIDTEAKGETTEASAAAASAPKVVEMPAAAARSADGDGPGSAPAANRAPAAPPQPRPGFGPSAPAGSARLATSAPTGDQVASGDADDLSPAVRRLVLQHQLDITRVPGSGPGGRVTKADVLAYLDLRDGQPTTSPAAPTAGAPEPLSFSGRSVETEPEPTRLSAVPPPAPGTSAAVGRQSRTKMSPLRARIAERLTQAQQTAAMLTTFNEADMSRVMALRAEYRDVFEKEHGVRLGFMSFFVKAVVDALQTVPKVNAFIEGDEIVTNHFFDIGVAVGTERGLVVPVIRGCDGLGFAEIERAIADAARKVKEKTISLEDLSGGCFTISNGGIYGSMLSTPILNFPQSGILGMHAIKKRAVVVDDAIEIRPMMYLALTYDHRLVDGSEAVTFLRRVVTCIEAPERMFLRT